MGKLIFKKMNIYCLHRNNILDHQKGRPAILLKYKKTKCLVWAGTSKLDELTKEQPLIININGEDGYFYFTGIEKVNTEHLIGAWSNYTTQKPWVLSPTIEKKIITKFTEFTNQKDPYKKITFLELNNQILKQENEILKQENELLKQQKQNDKELEIN